MPIGKQFCKSCSCVVLRVCSASASKKDRAISLKLRIGVDYVIAAASTALTCQILFMLAGSAQLPLLVS